MRRFQLMLPDRVLATINREAWRTGRTRADLIRQLIAESPLFEVWLNRWITGAPPPVPDEIAVREKMRSRVDIEDAIAEIIDDGK